MLSKIKALKGYRLAALDGLEGNVWKAKEFYFDDRLWTIRFLVANTGDWLAGRQILISTEALIAVVREEQSIRVNLTRQEIENSPSLDTDKLAARQSAESSFACRDTPALLVGTDGGGLDSCIDGDGEPLRTSTQNDGAWDPHLRSTQALGGCSIQALDGDFGRVVDFIFDDETWTIRYLIIDTGAWRPGKKVLVSTQWIERAGWSQSAVLVNLSRDAIRQSPEYSGESLPTRDYETDLHDHYKRKAYWVDELVNS